MVVKAIIKSCGLKSNRGAWTAGGDESPSLLLAEYKQEVQHVVMPTSTFKSVAWPAMIWARRGELSNRDLREPKREDDLPDVVVDD